MIPWVDFKFEPSFMQTTLIATISPAVPNSFVVGIIILILLLIGLLFFLYSTITAKKQVEKKLQFYSKLVDDNSVGFLFHSNNLIGYANNALGRMLRYPISELIGKNIIDLIHPNSFGDISVKNWFLVRKNQSWQADVKFVSRNGKEILANFSVQRIENDDDDSFYAVITDLSHRKDLNENVKETVNEIAPNGNEKYATEPFYGAIFEYNTQSRDLFLSNHWKEILGYANLQISNALDFWRSLIHPDDVSLFNEFWQWVEHGSAPDRPFEFRTKSNNLIYKWLQVKISVAYNEYSTPLRVVGYLSDITSLKEMERNYQDSMALLDRLLHQSQVPILLIDKQSRNIILASDGASKLYGYSPDEFKELKLDNLIQNIVTNGDSINKDLSDLIDTKIRIINEADPTEQEGSIVKEDPLPNSVSANLKRYLEKTVHVSQNGTFLHLQVIKNHLVYKERDCEMLTIFDESDVHKAINDLINKIKDSDKTLLLKPAFLTGVSHEVRTPLNSIIGLVELISHDETLPGSVRDNLASIMFSSKHLLGVLNDLLDLSMLEAGLVLKTNDRFSLVKLINESIQIIDPLAAAKGLNLRLSINPSFPEFVVGDEFRIKQILLKILSNSVKFTSEGYIRVSAKVSEISDKTCKVCISVSDTGVGIPENNIKSIFDLNAQAELDSFRMYGGTGIGLHICKKLVELLDGVINVNSIEGIGTNFWFEVPLSISLNTPDTTKIEIKTILEKDLKGMKVLLVEDDTMSRFVMSKFLTKWNAQFVEAENGKKAIDLLSRELFDIVLMDLHMPEIGGLEASRLIRIGDANSLDPEVPIIALTADLSSDLRDRITSAGMNDLILKPFDPEVLYGKILSATIMYKQSSKSITSFEALMEKRRNNMADSDKKTKALSALRTIFADDKNAAHSMLVYFMEQLPIITNRVQQCIDRDLIELAAQSLQRIKPGLQHLGFQELADQLIEFQIILRDPDQVHNIHQKANAFFEGTEKALKILKEVAVELEAELIPSIT
ncbi:MAG TPA: hypothetical protein DCM62_08650 [Bacteroidales bacterium]|nr:hypothetical protein [Bacteroidales bacterium]